MLNGGRFRAGLLLLSLGGLLLSSLRCGSTTSGGQQASGAGATGVAGAAGTGVPGGSAGSSVAGAGSSGAPSGVAGSTTSSGGGASGAVGTAGSGTTGGAGGLSGGGAAGAAGAAPMSLNNYDGPVFYVTSNDGSFYAYQETTWKQLDMWTGLPITDAARGIDADPVKGIVYIAHGGAGPNSNGSATKTGSLLAWSLYQNKVVYDTKFTHGVDQIAVGVNTIYVPSGEYTNDRNWYYVNDIDGSPAGTEPGGMNPHDTIFRNGHRYYGGTQDTYLYVLGLQGVTKVGPSPSGTAGVRPFTVNGAETRMYITWSNFRGFSVGDLTTGNILKTVNFGPNTCGLAAPSHGMSLSPDNSEVYVLDTCNNQIRVYDASDNPMLKATVTLDHPIHPGTENPCVWDCDKDGWITHSRDGKYVYVGDSGDVIDTTTHKAATYLDKLANCRHGFIEMDWTKGVITGTATHVGMGY
jgi:hypothetical protein